MRTVWFDRPVTKSQMFIRFENASTCEEVELRLALNVGKTGGLRWEVALISGEDGRPTQTQTVAWITQGQGGFSSAPCTSLGSISLVPRLVDRAELTNTPRWLLRSVLSVAFRQDDHRPWCGSCAHGCCVRVLRLDR